MPAHQDDAKKMEHLFPPVLLPISQPGEIFRPSLTRSTSEEGRMVMGKARQEADRMHKATPGKPVRAGAALAVPIAELGWDPIKPGDRNKLDHYRDLIILEDCRQGFPSSGVLTKFRN